MQFIRSLALILFMFVFTPPYAIGCMVSFPFMNAHNRFRMVRVWCATVTWMAEKLCGIRYTIKNPENLTAVADKPVILLSKHQSAWETIAFMALMPRPLCFVFKRELLFVPFFGWTLGMLKMVHINRKDGSNAFASVVRQGKERLADGSWVIMFPEGTRTRSGTKGKYKSGGARFAVETGALVVPIAHNAGRFWPRNSIRKYPGRITVSIGKAISPEGKAVEGLNREVEQWIEAEMRRIDPDSYRAESPVRGVAA